jgi:surface polysaccharide O-acyltransferase-like enzyme
MSVPASTIPDQTKSKIVYIDHLKVALTALVVLHHACVTYGAPGGWYYSEKTTLPGALIAMTVFVATNQAYFMGFFFFLSALFIPPSFHKKGAAIFIKDRLVRLGIPLVFYSFILSPVMNYLVYYYAGEHHITFFQFCSGYDNWVSFGVLWFVVALLLFTFMYILFRRANPIIRRIPSVNEILFFAAGIGVVSFLVRLVFPVGWVLDPVGFQLGHFPQYIALFIFGIMASNSHWLGQLTYGSHRKSTRIATLLVAVGLPVIFVIKRSLGNPVEWFSGGFHLESILYAFWEQLTGFAIVTALLCYGKQYWNTPSPFLKQLSRCAFAVYILHPFILIVLSLAIKNWSVDPALKLLIVAPAGLAGSFLLGFIAVKIPGVSRIV